jgi:hypothetical protein
MCATPYCHVRIQAIQYGNKEYAPDHHKQPASLMHKISYVKDRSLHEEAGGWQEAIVFHQLSQCNLETDSRS